MDWGFVRKKGKEVMRCSGMIQGILQQINVIIEHKRSLYVIGP